ncbi:MAG: sugar ABC transporter ATP-binding protein [Planctomycetes bacterium]|nr:sugar ABC transporter ATP-binding protein [Planctomycetota bacterium]
MTTNASNATTPLRLQMRGVCKRFGATVALRDVDLDVRTGEVHALIGENGAGKSTLMKILAGAHQPDAGQMWLDGSDYTPRDPADGRRAGVSMIYQELSLAQHLSVMENILLGMEPTIGPFVRWKAVRARAAEAMRQVGRPDIPLELPVARLSAAEQQLVEIARSVAVGCRVLVLDEPTSSLARDDARQLFQLVRRLKADGHSVVYISHVLEEVAEISDRFTVLRDGDSVGHGITAEASVNEIIAMMVGRQVDELYPRSPRTPGEVMLELTNVAGLRLLLSASLTLRRGEVLGIAGLVGAGRTELLRAIFGLDRVVSGEIRIGVHTGPATPHRRWLQGAGLLTEDRAREGLALNLSLADNLTMARLTGLGPCGLVTPSGQDRAARPWIQRIPIVCASPRQPVAALSGGNQQKVALARLLHADVDVLLLDEPTRGIDVGSKTQIYRLIDELAVGDPAQNRPPKAILIISSYLPELLGTCDRVAVMHCGRLGPARPVGETDEHQIMRAATGAGDAA